jgi:hypothetical protein
MRACRRSSCCCRAGVADKIDMDDRQDCPMASPSSMFKEDLYEREDYEVAHAL